MKIQTQLIILIAMALLAGDAMAQSRPARQSRNGGSSQRPSGQMRGGFSPNNPSRNLLLFALDVNGNLEISAAELQAATKSLLALDQNGDGRLSANELRNGTANSPSFDKPTAGRRPGPQGPPPDMQTKQQFIENEVARILSLDSNNDGTITHEELITQNKVLFEQVDTNKDEVLDRKELEEEANLLWANSNRAGPPAPPRPGRPPR